MKMSEEIIVIEGQEIKGWNLHKPLVQQPTVTSFEELAQVYSHSDGQITSLIGL